MSKQINKSKTSSKTESPSTTTANKTSSKYQRRGDAEKEREAKYAEEQAQIERQRLEKLDRKRKLEEEEVERNAAREEKKRKLAEESKARREAQEAEEDRLKRKRLGLPERPPMIDGEELADIEDEELRRKLGEMKETEEVEDESHADRLARYYRAQKALSRKKVWYPGPIPTTLEPLPADELILPEKPPSAENKEACAKLYRQIASYLNFVLTEWSLALSSRPKDDAQSAAGIAASNNYKIALEDLRPLMRRLEAGVYTDQQSTHKLLPHTSLLTPLVEILHLTQKRHYRDAVDAYLRLSIGKAAWPIGVTMVGIHERSAREKLHEDRKGESGETAHIMSDEGTRKWLQSLKRCVSFAQTRWEVWDVGQLMG